MQSFWSSMFTGNNAAAAAEAELQQQQQQQQPVAQQELPPSKRARTTTIPSLPAPQDLQYIQNLCWASTMAAAAASAGQAQAPAAAGGQGAASAGGQVAFVPVIAVANMPLAATSSVPSSSAMQFLLPLPTPVMPDMTTNLSSSNSNINNITSSSSDNFTITNNNNKRTREDAIKAKQEERKRRNAENARITRMRKKHAATLVELELKTLQRENEWLKSIVKREIPYDTAQQIINDCCYKGSEAYKHIINTTDASLLRTMGFDVNDPTMTSMTTTSAARTGGGGGVLKQEKPHEQLLGRSDFELLESLAKEKASFVLSDPRQVDNPIVYASCSFLRLTGYTREQVIGRNCRFLQGIDTDPEQVTAIREAVESGKDGAACLINYKADGTPFWNHFFITALRDKKNRIVNYVGVQTEVDKPLDGIEPMMPAANAATASAAPNGAAAATTNPTSNGGSNPQESVGPAASLTAKLCRFEQEKLQRLNDNPIDMSKLQELEEEEKNQKMPASSIVPATPIQIPIDLFDDTAGGVNMIDWSQLAAVLEADFEDSDFEDIGSVDDTTTDNSHARSSNTAEDFETDLLFEKSYFSFFTKAPRELVILTIRSEIVDSMTRNDGDVSDPGFMSALELLSKMYHRDRSSSSSSYNNNNDDIIHGQWREISRPTYQHGGIIGTNDRGDKVYSLGKMSFSMFKPGNLRVTVQSTINCIEPKADHKALPAAVPWSLRRELAQQGEQPSSSKLKSYDVVLAVTIEPGQFNAAPGETIPSPSQRLRATYMVSGWFLPDPETPGRLSVWFTGGQLSPVPTQQPAQSPHESFSEDTQQQQNNNNSSLDEWISIFGAEHKRTWGEALSVMGAQLFLGAELPDGMEPDGTMSYTLHRPYGGHGRGYVDIMYADSEMLITKGNSGTVHVMVREDGTANNNNNAGN